MLAWIRSAFDPNDESANVHDVIAAAVIVSFVMGTLTNMVCLIAYIYIHSPPDNILNAVIGCIFDAQKFGIGGAAIIGAIGTAGWLKDKHKTAITVATINNNTDNPKE